MDLLLGAADVFLKNERPLAAAVALTVALRDGFDTASPQLLCSLGTALARSAGTFVRAPFLEHATKAFVRCQALGDSKYGPVADEWLAELRGETTVDGAVPHRRDELPELLRFLDVDDRYLLEAIDAVSPDDQMMLAMALTEKPEPVFARVLVEGVRGRWGDGPARSALKRAPRWPADAALGEALAAAAASPRAEELQPYLQFAQEAFAKAGGSAGGAPSTPSGFGAPGSAAPSGGLFANAAQGLSASPSSSGNPFAQASASAPSSPSGNPFAQASASAPSSSAPSGNPFAQASASAPSSSAPSGNPFAQASAPSSGNPFAQASSMGPLPKGPEGFPLWRSLFGLAGIGLGLFVAYDAGGNGRFDESQVFVGGAIALVGASFFTWGFFSRAKNLAFGMPILVALLVGTLYFRVSNNRTEWFREDAALRIAQPVCESGGRLPDAPAVYGATSRSVLVYEGFGSYETTWYPWRDGPRAWRPTSQPHLVACVERPSAGGSATLTVRAAQTGEVLYTTTTTELYGTAFDTMLARELTPFLDGTRP